MAAKKYPDIAGRAADQAQQLAGLRDRLGLRPAPLSATADGSIPAQTLVRSLAIADLWLEAQPRQIVPESLLAVLIAERRAQPAVLLATLQELTRQDDHAREVLERLEELAASIRAEGVLEPIHVVVKDGQYVIRDGHRRSLASLLAGKTTIPAIENQERSDLDAMVRPLILNVQREDLTAMEKAATLQRIAGAVRECWLEAKGWPADDEPGSSDHVVTETPADAAGADAQFRDHVVTEVLPQKDGVDDAIPEVPADETEILRRIGSRRELEAELRDWIMARTGLRRRTYYRLIALNDLSAEARRLGAGLSEGQLRPVTTLPVPYQEAVTAIIVKENLSSRQATELVDSVRAAPASTLQRLKASLGLSVKQERVRASWWGMFRAVPEDWPQILAVLDADLRRLQGKDRAKRLKQLEGFAERIGGVQQGIRLILDREKGGDGPPPASNGTTDKRIR